MRKAIPTIKTHPKLRDAKDGFEFEVVRDDVKGSRVGDYTDCAGARALIKHPDITRAWVTRTRTVLEFHDGRLLKYQNPSILQAGVENYDASAGVFPEGKYALLPVCKSQRQGVRSTRADDRGKRETARTRFTPAHVLR